MWLCLNFCFLMFIIAIMGIFVNRSFMSKVMHLWCSLSFIMMKLLAICAELSMLYVLGSCINSGGFFYWEMLLLCKLGYLCYSQESVYCSLRVLILTWSLGAMSLCSISVVLFLWIMWSLRFRILCSVLWYFSVGVTFEFNTVVMHKKPINFLFPFIFINYEDCFALVPENTTPNPKTKWPHNPQKQNNTNAT
jgi:hypothetical protein